MQSQEDDININKISHGYLVKCLTQNECPKNVVLAKDMSRIIDLIIKFTELKSLGVLKAFYLEKSLPKINTETHIEWIYVIRPYVEDIQTICDHIKEDIKNNYKPYYPYKVLFSPRKLFFCDRIFEQEGLYEYVVTDELENDLIQIDTDLLSMEYPQFLTNYFMSGDQTWFPSIAKSLINIQQWYGKIPNIHIHGSCAKGVYELMKRLESLTDAQYGNTTNSTYKIGHLILVDRNIDLITPFCTPLTYEARIDETFKIKAGAIDMPVPDSDAKRPVHLSSGEKVFENIRYMHVSEVSMHLSNLLNELKNIQEKKNQMTSVSDMKEFINTDLKNYDAYKKLLHLHLSISEIIINQSTFPEFNIYLTTEQNILRNSDYKRCFDYIEELINRNFDMNKVLRLMILLSKTSDGLSNADYTQLSNQFLRSYGYEKTYLLQKLRKLGLFESVDKTDDPKPNILKFPQQLKAKIISSNYSNITKKLDILPNEISPGSLKSTNKNVDISYVSNGVYRPILVKYISQMLFSDNMKIGMDEFSRLFPGEYSFSSNLSYSVRDRTGRQSQSDRTALIFFLGGCSFTEIAALKKLAAQKNFKFIFATTSFLNAQTVIDLVND